MQALIWDNVRCGDIIGAAAERSNNESVKSSPRWKKCTTKTCLAFLYWNVKFTEMKEMHDQNMFSVFVLKCQNQIQIQLSLLPSAGWKWVVAYGLRGEGPVWLIGAVTAVVCLCAAPRVRVVWAMDGRIMRHGIISSCQSAATSEIVKRCCSSLRKQRYSKYQDLYLYLLYHRL